MTMIDTEQPVVEFTAYDRCDKCRAQAYTLAKHEEFGELLFCGHHSKEYRMTLFESGWTIVDDLEALEDLGYTFPQLTSTSS